MYFSQHPFNIEWEKAKECRIFFRSHHIPNVFLKDVPNKITLYPITNCKECIIHMTTHYWMKPPNYITHLDVLWHFHTFLIPFCTFFVNGWLKLLLGGSHFLWEPIDSGSLMMLWKPIDSFIYIYIYIYIELVKTD
jgi:hypothetical protein